MSYFSSNKKMSGDSMEMRELASRICREYLHGAWKSVTAQNIGFKHISGGLSNLLYHISLPESLIKYQSKTQQQDDQQPKEVLIRVYGQTHGERALESLITDSVIFTLLSERGLGPKLHGIFPGGRIEQYINARPLLTRELADEKLSLQIAQKMAQIHSMQVPLHKQPRWLWDTIARWTKTCDKKFESNQVPDVLAYLVDLNLRDEAKWLKQRLEQEHCPVVFCHNDMQEGNILISQQNNKDAEEDDSKMVAAATTTEVQESANIVLIDFEYCSYNYRSFDIANHFVEWIYDYTAKEHPFYTENINMYPTERQRYEFIHSYLEERGDTKENPAKVMQEIEVFTLASHLFWGLWGVINADTSSIPFGYWEYASSRFNHYFQLKKKVMQQEQTTMPMIATVKRKFDDTLLDD